VVFLVLVRDGEAIRGGQSVIFTAAMLIAAMIILMIAMITRTLAEGGLMVTRRLIKDRIRRLLELIPGMGGTNFYLYRTWI
jgi:hypothetical protein